MFKKKKKKKGRKKKQQAILAWLQIQVTRKDKERQDDNKSMNTGFCSHVRLGIGVRDRVDDVGVGWGFVICM